MCSINKFNEYCGIFEEQHFGLSALDFFRELGHTLVNTPYLVAEDISYCIYFNLGFNYTFTKQESECFSYIKQLSLLFEIDDDVFEKKANRIIKYYAIEISVAKSNRSHIAHIIHNAFSRESEYSTVIIFRNYEECMISISYGIDLDSTNKVYLSDWISTNSSINYIESIKANNLSAKSSVSFLSDFIYFSSREYYIYSFSKGYIYNQIINFDYFRIDYALEKDAVEKFVEDMLNSYINIYGDDYIEINEIKEQQIDNDFDFELLEFEMDIESDEMEEFGYEESDEEYYDSVDNDTDVEQIRIDEIHESILNDPIKLIKWLEKVVDEN